MIRPVITNEAFTLRSFGGIVNYFLRLLPELDALGVDPVVVAPFHRSGDIDRSPYLRAPHRALADDARYVNTLANVAAFVQERLETIRRRDDELVLHRSYFYRDHLQVRLPTVITVYDLIAELLPEERAANTKLIDARARAIEQADHIIAISDTTKGDIVRHFGIDPQQITVTPLASGLVLPASRSATDCSPGSSVLFVGNRGGYKNFAALLDALADPAVPERLTLDAYGGGSFTEEERRTIDDRGLAGRVTHVAPDDATLDRLYRRALAYVCPSRYEGFGLPVLEAMERGCAVVVARSGSLIEVAGDAALSFDPDDTAGLAKHLVDLLEQPELVRTLAAAGRARSSCFDWRSTAHATVAAYRATLEAAR